MEYLTYDEYKEYGGALDETTFNDYEFEAEATINWYTFNRLADETSIPEAVKRCMMKLIAFAKLKADAMALGQQSIVTTDAEGKTTTVTTSASIASQSNDGVSVSYNTISASEIFNKLTSTESGNEIELLVQRYLSGIKNSLGKKLLYRGLYPDE